MTMNIKKIKLASENNRSLGAVTSHWGRKDFWDGQTGVRHSFNWDAIRCHLTQEPIATLSEA